MRKALPIYINLVSTFLRQCILTTPDVFFNKISLVINNGGTTTAVLFQMGFVVSETKYTVCHRLKHFSVSP